MPPVTDCWSDTACILGSLDRGVRVRTDGSAFIRIVGDKEHMPARTESLR